MKEIEKKGERGKQSHDGTSYHVCYIGVNPTSFSP